jgi:NADH dehydrogenase (ubiquinone) Fe-S protein 3
MVQQSLLELSGMLPILYCQLVKDELVISSTNSNTNFCLYFLKNHSSYRLKLLSCISGVDLFSKRYRFCVSYDLLSLKNNFRIRVKTFTDEVEPLTSSISIFINANWWEREIWDLFGIFFTKHNDLRRILTDYGFEGHPLRKDFPLFGYTEVSYNEVKKRVVSERVLLSQEYRDFTFKV